MKERTLLDITVLVFFRRGDNTLRELVMFHPIASSCYVEDDVITEPLQLQHGVIIRLGENNYYRFFRLNNSVCVEFLG